MKIAEVLAHTVDDDKHYEQMLQGYWQRQSSADWQAQWPFQTLTTLPGGVTALANHWPPSLRQTVFFVNQQGPIGFAIMHKGGRDGDYQNDSRYGINMIWMAPQYRMQGIAKAFYDFLQHQAGIGLMPDKMQSAGGEALWKNRTPAPPVLTPANVS